MFWSKIDDFVNRIITGLIQGYFGLYRIEKEYLVIYNIGRVEGIWGWGGIRGKEIGNGGMSKGHRGVLQRRFMVWVEIGISIMSDEVEIIIVNP